MFTQIQVHNDKAKVSSAALKKIILDHLPSKILDLMHTTNLNGKTDHELINIITKAGRTAEQWEDTGKSLASRSHHKDDKLRQKVSKNRFKTDYKQSTSDYKQLKKDRMKFKQDKKEFKSNRQKGSGDLEGIDSSELKRRRVAGECLNF
jgi:hypothetical protein